MYLTAADLAGTLRPPKSVFAAPEYQQRPTRRQTLPMSSERARSARASSSKESLRKLSQAMGEKVHGGVVYSRELEKRQEERVGPRSALRRVLRGALACFHAQGCRTT